MASHLERQGRSPRARAPAGRLGWRSIHLIRSELRSVSAPSALILGWARSAVAAHGGAFERLEPHQIAAPVVRDLLARTKIPAGAIDTVVLGNALGAGGNPARMVAL